MTVAIAIATGITGLMLGGSLGVLLGAALGAHRREELERTIAWLERLQRTQAAVASPQAAVASPRHPADDLVAPVRQPAAARTG